MIGPFKIYFSYKYYTHLKNIKINKSKATSDISAVLACGPRHLDRYLFCSVHCDGMPMSDSGITENDFKRLFDDACDNQIAN